VPGNQTPNAYFSFGELLALLVPVSEFHMRGGSSMRYPLLQTFSGSSSPSQSWLMRVVENFQQLLSPAQLSAAGMRDAPFSSTTRDSLRGTGRAQSYSLLTHTAILGALALLATSPSRAPNQLRKPPFRSRDGIIYIPRAEQDSGRQASLGKSSGGGENEPTPATRGELATRARFQVLAPRLPQESPTPVPATILDLHAPPNAVPVTDLGLPWMNAETNSAGPGKNHGIGKGPDGAMGDQSGDEAGQSDDRSPYAAVVSSPTCRYCPDPTYPEVARKAKLQGTVTLSVLVGADGTAKQVRVLKGLGMELDEQAIARVRTWRFLPARDAAHRAVADWVTIEAIYRLL
jgi:TonB family protein